MGQGRSGRRWPGHAKKMPFKPRRLWPPCTTLRVVPLPVSRERALAARDARLRWCSRVPLPRSGGGGPPSGGGGGGRLRDSSKHPRRACLHISG
jgi:hypothetical protein